MRELEEVIKCAESLGFPHDYCVDCRACVQARRELEEWAVTLSPWAIEHPESYAPQQLIRINRLLGREEGELHIKLEQCPKCGRDIPIDTGGECPSCGQSTAPSPAFQEMREACELTRQHLIGDFLEPGRTVFWKNVKALKLADAERGGEGEELMRRDETLAMVRRVNVRIEELEEENFSLRDRIAELEKQFGDEMRLHSLATHRIKELEEENAQLVHEIIELEAQLLRRMQMSGTAVYQGERLIVVFVHEGDADTWIELSEGPHGLRKQAVTFELEVIPLVQANPVKEGAK